MFLLFMLTISFFPIQVSATEQKSKIEHCKSLVGGGMYNQLLEAECGFDGGVASKILYLYRTGGYCQVKATLKKYAIIKA